MRCGPFVRESAALNVAPVAKMPLPKAVHLLGEG